MANILILGVKVPYTSGGQEVLVRSLYQQLKAKGHLVDILEIPFQIQPKEGLLNQCAIWRSLDLKSFSGVKVDLVIATKFPSYYVKHPSKVIWLVHQHRPIYDLYGTRYSDFSDDPRDELLREKLTEGDNKVLAEAKYIASISKNVSNRLKMFNQINSEILYPPLPLGDQYYLENYAPYILSVGRICSIKRVDLMIKSLPMIHEFIKLKVVGTPDEPGVMDYLHNEITKHHLTHRVEFLGRVSDAELLSLYANCLAVYYAPFNEDYGYVTLEAKASSKPVVTGIDSGGVLEFVNHQLDSLVVEPNIDEIAKAFNLLAEDQELAKKLGSYGRQWLENQGIITQGWSTIIDKLTSSLT